MALEGEREMSCCYVPGQIIVVPKPGNNPLEKDESILCSAKEWLGANNLVDGDPDAIPVPFIKKVPVGDELRSAMRLVAADGVAAALPNHYLRADQTQICSGHVTLNERG